MTLTENFVEEIEEMIFTGKLVPGERMPTVRELVDSMHVSQSVVNNGISILAQRGLLKIVPRKGTYVVDYLNEGGLSALASLVNYSRKYLPANIMRSMYDFRLSNERMFFHKAAQLMTDSDHEEIDRLIQGIIEGNDSNIQADLAYRTIQFVSKLSGNEVYIMITHGFKPLYEAVYEKFFRVADIKEEADYLSEILSALRSIDGERLDAALTAYHEFEFETLKKHRFFSQSEST
jgi:DNA-binding FadR family transcriptional regulator